MALAGQARDSDDQNLPLMIWYGIEPLVPANPSGMPKLAAAAEIPQLRQFLARRVVEHTVSLGEKGNLDPLIVALAAAGEAAQLDLLTGARDGLRGRKKMTMPAGWAELYPRLNSIH